MQILAISKLTKEATPENVQSHLLEELIDTIELYLESIIRDFYFRTDKDGVIFMMECSSIDEANLHISNLKLVKEGLLEFDLIPLGPLKPLKMLLKFKQ
jgi:hypothetical protein